MMAKHVSKCEVVWAPGKRSDSFLALSPSELTVFKTSSKPIPDGNNATQLTSDSFAVPVRIFRDLNSNNVSLIGWCPSAEHSTILAIARNENVKIVNCETFGKDMFTSFILTTKGTFTLESKELYTCSALCWNPFEPNLLATGFIKGKSFIWDINLAKAAKGVNDANYYEIPLESGESVTSLAWRYCQQMRCLIVGTSTTNKDRLKIIHVKDIKEPKEWQLVASTWTKAVYHVTPHPSNKDLFLSAAADGYIHLWDIRNFSCSFAVLNSDQKLVNKVAWSPFCDGNGQTAAVLYRDASHIRIFTVFHLYGQDGSSASTGETEPFVADRQVSFPQQAISSFSWHKDIKNCLVSLVSRKLVGLQFEDPITLHILPSNKILCCEKRKIYTLVMNPPENRDDIDLTDLIKYRIKCGYGFDLSNCWGSMAKDVISHPNNIAAKPFWDWLETRRNLAGDGKFDLRGIKTINQQKTSVNAQPAPISGRGRLPSLNMQQPSERFEKLESSNQSVKVYSSPERANILRLCGWPVLQTSDSATITKFVNEVAGKEGCIPRAAAIALYLLRLPLALEVLSRGESDTNNLLSIVALALPGVISELSNLPSVYDTHLNKVTEPYLKLMLTFGRFVQSADSLLYDDGLVMDDRVAIAAMYLPDDKFQNFINNICRQYLKDGQLSALSFTGVDSREFINLLQNFINLTGDIQTVALGCAYIFSNGQKVPEEVENWTESYRQLLNRFSLFRDRAAFDDLRKKLGVNIGRPRPSVSLGCGYCEKAVVQQGIPLAGMQRVLPIYCQACKRPLPRCAVCLARVGDDGWITWCQTCRHGGHAHHLQQWFSQHAYCPVVGCRCFCMQLDAPF